MGIKSSGKKVGGLLTQRQIQILELRKKGMTQLETANSLGISRQDVSVLEKRAMRNINIATDTLQMAENIGLVKRFHISKGQHILDVAKAVISFADSEHIKIRTSALGIMTLIQAASSSTLEGGTVLTDLEGVILPDGRVSISNGS